MRICPGKDLWIYSGDLVHVYSSRRVIQKGILDWNQTTGQYTVGGLELKISMVSMIVELPEGVFIHISRG